MEKFALLARVEAKPGKEKQVAEFLKSALPMAQAETETVRWYGLQITINLKLGIFYIRTLGDSSVLYDEINLSKVVNNRFDFLWEKLKFEHIHRQNQNLLFG